MVHGRICRRSASHRRLQATSERCLLVDGVHSGRKFLPTDSLLRLTFPRAKLQRQIFMTRAEVWAKNWAKFSAHFRASFAVQDDPQIFSQNSSQFITPCLVVEILKFLLRELLGFGGHNSLFFQINSVVTYRYRYRSVIISNQFLFFPIPIPIPLQGSVPRKSPICNSSELIMENLPIPIQICNFFELIR